MNSHTLISVCSICTRVYDSPYGKMRLHGRGLFRIFLRSLRFPHFLITSAFYVFLATIFAIFIMFLSCNKSYFPHLFHYCKNDRNISIKRVFLCLFLYKLKYIKMPRILQLHPRILAMSASRFFLFGCIFPGGKYACTHTRTLL